MKIDIERLVAIQVEPGDVIVAKIGKVTMVEADAVWDRLAVLFPDNQVLIVSTLVDLEVYRPVAVMGTIIDDPLYVDGEVSDAGEDQDVRPHG